MATVLSRKPIATLDRNHADARHHVDWSLMATTLALVLVGMVAIYSARYRSLVNAGASPLYYVERQGAAFAVGMVGMALAMAIDYRRLRDFAWVLFAGTTVLLAGVVAYGRTLGGATAWFAIGPFQLQPSELAKVTLILVLASVLANQPHDPLPFRPFVAALVIGAVPAGLTLLQPDLGTASVMIAITMGILLVAGANARHIALVSVLAVVSAGVLWATGGVDQYQVARITDFLSQSQNATDQGSGYQVEKAKTAIGLGGLVGQGFKQGSMTNGGFVPENHTDFIFAAWAEQFGMLGSALVLALYAFLCFRLIRIALLSKDMLGSLIAAGAIAMVAWHVFENVGMNLGIMPVTGIPLPFLSYGGSALIAFLTLMGLCQNVHMRRFQ